MEYYHSRYGSSRKKKKKSGFKRFLLWFIFVIILVAAGGGYYVYRIIFTPNVWTAEGKDTVLYIPTGSDYEDVKLILYSNGLIIQRKNFEWWAEKKNYPLRVIPGRYIIKNGLDNNELINLLRSGSQTPVMVIFNNVRNVYQLAGKVGAQIEADSTTIVQSVFSKKMITRTGLDSALIKSVFIPNTYEFYWNTSADEFLDRMLEENEKFWNNDRVSKAAAINLSKDEVVTLASIIEKESNKNDEKPVMAGVYLNRLEHGWRLQADPTVVYAIGDFNIKRVLNVHKRYESPYNTYLHLGLPPGPICIPSISSIDAVLNYDDNDYFFFCAKDDLSGYHVFAKTNAQHRRNAKKYRKPWMK